MKYCISSFSTIIQYAIENVIPKVVISTRTVKINWPTAAKK